MEDDPREREGEEAEADVVPFPSQHPSRQVDPAQRETGPPEQFDLDFGWLSSSGEPQSSDDEARYAEAPPEEAPADEGIPATSEEDDDEEGWQDRPPDAFTPSHYFKATSQEYEELARAMDEAETQDHVPQAVSVAVPGLDQGIVGFEDVVGDREIVEEVEEPELFVRVATGIALAAVFLVAFMLPEPAILAALVVLLGLLGVLEFYGTVRVAGFNPMVLLGLLGSAGMLVGAWLAGEQAPFVTASLLAATVVVLMLWYVLTGMKRPLENGSLTLLGVIWIGGLLSFAMPIIGAADYRPLVLFVVIVNTALDAGSYFVGRGMGRTRLAPALSPQKTVEGLVGGAVLALGIGAGLSAVSYFDVLDVAQAIGLAAAIVVFSPLGDLSESLIKRSLGVKDMGSVLPGHGGLLDRIDGLIFALPASYFALLWMGIIQ